jgi:hypothetical protein
MSVNQVDRFFWYQAAQHNGKYAKIKSVCKTNRSQFKLYRGEQLD